MKLGKLIVIDGIDGSGKATQTKILVEKLRNQGQSVETLDFPQYTQNFFGGMVRRYLNGEFGVATEVNPYLASLLYAADRWESSKKIQNWLAEGKIVILDRYYTSNLIHQASKLSAEQIDQFIDWDEKVELEVFKIPKPDLIIYLHLAAETAHEWITKRGQGHDGLDTIEHMKKSEAQCLRMAAIAGWEKIECSKDNQIQSVEESSELVYQKIIKLL
ncbi:MAG: dTMP kinase [Candidatus Buchananbacteria bacterium]